MESKLNDLNVDVQIKSPMGWIKVLVDVAMEEDNEHFHGTARLMGYSNDYTGGTTNGHDYVFDISVKLPFGKLDVHIDAAIEADGMITGSAIVPRRKPMEIKGHVVV